MAGNAAFITIVVGVFAFLVNFSLHKLEEGHVGVYYRVSAVPCTPELLFIGSANYTLYKVNLIFPWCSIFCDSGWCFIIKYESAWLSHDDSLHYIL